MNRIVIAISIIVSSCFGQNVFAQSSKVWYTSNGLWTWENETDANEDLLFSWTEYNFPFTAGSVISHSNGTPFLNNNFVNVTNLNTGELIPHSDSIIPLINRNNCWFQRNDSTYDLVGHFDTAYAGHTTFKGYYKRYEQDVSGYRYDTLETMESGWYAHTFVKTKQGLKLKQKNKMLRKDESYYWGLKAYRFRDYEYRFAINKVFTIGMYSMKDGELTYMDSLDAIDPKSLFQEPIPLAPASRNYHGLRIMDVILNFEQSKMFFIAEARIELDTFGKKRDVSFYSGLFEVDMNPATGEIVSAPKELLRYQRNTPPTLEFNRAYSHNYLSGLCISPNDSVLYFYDNNNTTDSIGNTLYATKTNKLMAWRYIEGNFNPQLISQKQVQEQGSGHTHEVLNRINPYGKLVTLGKDPKVLMETNSPQGSSSSRVGISGVDRFMEPTPYIYDYVRLADSISYDCEATVFIKNNSDLSRSMNQFTWYFTKEDGSIDTVSGYEPVITYKVNGDYPFKCHGYSPAGLGYGEFYIDTLRIRIPEKPVAEFVASDTLVCAFSALTFTDQSSALDTHPTNPQKWVWSFGDGTTQTDELQPGENWNTPYEVSHVYDQAGLFSVSLFYSNGYCDSTLVKNQYIKVVDAPKPGFSIDNIRGCAPFKITIQDTVKLNTTKKEYYYSDVDQWVEVPVNQAQFSHSFDLPGSYWIVQRLYGYTGCITQIDSFRIYVSPGLTKQDILHVLNSSYQDASRIAGPFEISGTSGWDSTDQIHLFWQGLDAATDYEIRRNSGLLVKVPSNASTVERYTDFDLSRELYTYIINGVDSCGNTSASGRIGQPIFMRGEVQGNNELAIIRFNNYKDWGLDEIEYTIYEESNGQWIPMENRQDNADYTDISFLSLDPSGISSTKLEKCYRIVGRSATQTTISNVLCLPYGVAVFLPNAFSPNADNINDSYKPVTFGIKSYRMQVYNRWGQMLGEYNEDSPGWMGYDQMQDTYFITLRAVGVDNTVYTYKQTVNLLR